MFLNNDDFYQLRRITLSGLLDTQSALLLTNKVALQAKATLFKLLNPTFTASKKRNIKRISKGDDVESDSESDEDMQIIKDFEHEAAFTDLYEEPNDHGIKFIDLDKHSSRKLYVAISEKTLLRQLDLKREVVLTMLN